MLSRLQKFCRANFSRGLILCGVVGLLLSHFPLPVPHQAKDASSPFPCLDRTCGCHSAEQCWKRCCCFTNRQKVAWAKARNVQLPEFVYVAAHDEEPASTPSKACCHKTAGVKRTQKSCTSPAMEPTGKVSPTKHTFADVKPSEAASTPLIGVHAQQCQGQTSLWSLLPWSMVPTRVEVVFQRDHLGLVGSMLVFFLPSHAVDPPVPPPREFLIA